MCHVASWCIDHVAKPPHGDVFKKWAKRVEQVKFINYVNLKKGLSRY